VKTKASPRVLSDEEKKELDELKARLAELEPAQEETERTDSRANPKRASVPLDEYVPVMSLLPYRLNLSTREGGQGDIKKFSRFGEIKNILFRDLVNIAEVNRSFLEAGYFYILNKDVIRQLGLDEIYSEILTKEKIEEILNSLETEHCVELYETANKKQQQVIVQLFVDKMKENPESVNLYTVDRVSRLSGIDISRRVAEEKRMAEELAEVNQQ
jgi:hypothetical protein